MCDRNAVSSEHVPPKNLFPEQKDVGKDYRQYLITVPSCEIHNNHKSKDDEFLIVDYVEHLEHHLSQVIEY